MTYDELTMSLQRPQTNRKWKTCDHRTTIVRRPYDSTIVVALTILYNFLLYMKSKIVGATMIVARKHVIADVVRSSCDHRTMIARSSYDF